AMIHTTLARVLLGMALAALAPAAATAVETVRVDASSGAPRIVIDGKPVRARMFWGAPGARPMPIAAKPQEVAFEFTASEDEPAKATMHFRFGQTAGDIYLDDIRVVDLADGQSVFPAADFEGGQESFTKSWTFWPTGAANTVGAVTVEPKVGRDGSAGLHLALKAPPGGHWPDFHIYHHANLALRKGHRYRVSLWVRAEPARDLTIAFYQPGETFTFLGGPPGVFEEQIRLAAAAGVDFVSFPVGLPWPRPGRPVDWAGVDASCKGVLDANPKALLVPRIGMDPPPWWREAHPDDVMVWDKGPQEHTPAVVASPEYRRDAAAQLAALVAHLEEKFGDHMAGYHPCGQNTGEWFYQDTWNLPLNGYAKGDLREWRVWLKARYQGDAALRAAWRDAAVTLDTAAVPTPAARYAAPAGWLRDPVAERLLIDFAEFQQQAMADCVCDLAHAVRQASKGCKLVLFFYGYVFEFGPVRNGPGTSGHYALRRVLDCPDIDILCSPISYNDRGLGQGAPSMTAAESVALAGKMWLNEDDTHTYLATGTQPGYREHVTTLAETNQQLVRNVAQEALRNFGTWWMDLGATGWFNDKRMWDEMARLKALDQPLLDKPLPYRPEVAAAIDERSMMRVAAGGQVVTAPGVCLARQPLGRMGAPYGQYLMDDVAGGKVRAKMVVLLTAWCMSPGERRQLLAATRGSTRLWCYAPGWQEPGGTSLEAMRELTGFQFKKLSNVKALATPTEAGKKLGLTQAFGVAKPIEPLFAAADATPDDTLATYPDGSAAVAMRKTADGVSIFVGPPGLTSELLRLAARQAGVHLFAQTDCNIYASGPYLVLHASQDGPVEIDTGRAAAVRDVLTGEAVGQGPKLTLPLKKGETRVLNIGEK
ncbi:MAG: beta-galactosidase, partial [Planctomycetota bacterium]|nr:beta-galactosidase [Planctomycetota bacterium]